MTSALEALTGHLDRLIRVLEPGGYHEVSIEEAQAEVVAREAARDADAELFRQWNDIYNTYVSDTRELAHAKAGLS